MASHELTFVKYTDDVPEWIRTMVDQMVSIFRLHEWMIEVSMKDCPGGDADAGGYCVPSTRYKKAWIEFSRDAKDEPEWRKNVVHEVLHIVGAPMTRVVEHLLEFVPEGSRKVVSEMFDDALEQQTEALARGLYSLPVWGETQEEDTLDSILPG